MGLRAQAVDACVIEPQSDTGAPPSWKGMVCLFPRPLLINSVCAWATWLFKCRVRYCRSRAQLVSDAPCLKRCSLFDSLLFESAREAFSIAAAEGLLCAVLGKPRPMELQRYRPMDYVTRIRNSHPSGLRACAVGSASEFWPPTSEGPTRPRV